MVTTIAVPRVELPERIARLEDLAFNLWWSWHRSARRLFRELNPVLWDLV